MVLTFVPVLVPFTCSATSADVGRSAQVRQLRARPYGYWKKSQNLVRELQNFASAQNNATRMPTQAELLAAGRSDIVGAIRRHGNWPSAAKISGLIPTSIVRPRSVYLSFCNPISGARPHNYWRSFENLRTELEPYITANKLPNAAQLCEKHRSDLVRAIRLHGGFPAVSMRLQLRTRYRSTKYWMKFNNVATELNDFIKAHGVEGVMPPLTLLREGAPQGLVTAIQYRHGGCTVVAKRMGLKCEHPRRPHGYWQSQDNRIREMLAFMEELQKERPTRDVKRMPSYSEMLFYRRQDLAAGLMRYGGLGNMAKLLGLHVYRKKRN